ncbi:MAG: Asp-tRNA(Asn)/Glu-tRNA(Gln) amidotransferase subunit GatB [Acidimicrobiaceae bacterium]|nr:Asp-tRNA(Asn)/Glu-tRNA(Gln) amidotransferase subunit GatB [Acidimicrobiaceae bacterium]
MSRAVPQREPAVPDDWELVVGLEVHVELSTATKLFCGCANRFGDEPNTNVCPVCLGLPGSLPVANAEAVDCAMRLGRALGCEVRGAVFARKNYFYPDMPKDYQISQYDQPTNTDGRLELPDGHTVGIERAHIEEDTGKTTHIGGGGRIHDADYALVDYNRAGVPLVEIVSRPDIRTAEQARAYVRELRAILLAIDVSDARMEEGSMRVDANVSVRPTGSDELRTRCEIKNLSSLRALGRAIVYEAQRHVDLWSGGERPRQETRHWDEANGRTTPGRSKEDADDYRYFQDPDLVPLAPAVEKIAAIDAALPPLPAARRADLVEAARRASLAILTGKPQPSDPDAREAPAPDAPEPVSPETAALLVERGQDGLVRAAMAEGADPELTATRVTNDLAIDDWSSVTPEGLAALVAMEASEQITATQSKQVLAEMAERGGAPEEIARRRGFRAMAGDDLAAVVDGVIADNPDAWSRYRAGDDAERKKLSGFLTGQVMRATKGQADGAAVNRLLQERAGPTSQLA